MAILQWALICSKVITDKDTNSVSYIDAIEAFLDKFETYELSTIQSRYIENLKTLLEITHKHTDTITKEDIEKDAKKRAEEQKPQKVDWKEIRDEYLNKKEQLMPRIKKDINKLCQN